MKPILAMLSGVLALSIPTLAHAQDNADKDGKLIANSPVIGKLETCTALSDNAERLACFDREVGALVGASKEGDVRVVETEDITNARRKLYGYSLPNVGIFEAATKEEKEEAARLQSVVTKVRQVSSKEWHFWIEEGDARWRVKSNSIRFKAPKVGDEVEFEPASLGTYWIRLNGRKGVRGNRVG